MVGYMTKNDTVGQGGRDVLGHGNTQPRFNLQPQLIDVRISGGGFLHVMPSVAAGGRGQIVAVDVPVGG